MKSLIVVIILGAFIFPLMPVTSVFGDHCDRYAATTPGTSYNIVGPERAAIVAAAVAADTIDNMSTSLEIRGCEKSHLHLP